MPHGDPQPLHIDVQALFYAKNPRLAARIPAVGYRYLRRIVHERQINAFLTANAALSGCAFVMQALQFLDIGTVTHYDGRLPDDPRIVLCANHPTGGADGLCAMQLLCRRYGSLRVPANDLLTTLPGLREFIVPVDKYGSNAGQVRQYDRLFACEHPVLVFPAGRTARPGPRGLLDYPWSKTFIRKAREHDRIIVPLYIAGRNSRFFYALWRLRRALRVDANLEMLYLVDELFRQRGRRIELTVGTPLRVFAGNSHSDLSLAAHLRMQVHRLGRGGAAGTEAPAGTASSVRSSKEAHQ
ncbi:MAG: hypothetical protein EA384_08415 [Spirochaetaceae bacterium]|nr:MAG: hypothetical protein EA384_08415 [Spirochaetaceae bacterium]